MAWCLLFFHMSGIYLDDAGLQAIGGIEYEPQSSHTTQPLDYLSHFTSLLIHFFKHPLLWLTSLRLGPCFKFYLSVVTA